MRPIGVGIVGLGFGARVHLPGFQGLEGARVIALCARDVERARLLAGEAGVPRAYGDWRELVADEEVELVSIATPPATHVEIGLAALELGKVLMCEKPLATSVEDAERLTAAAESAEVPTLVDFEFRAVAAFQKARELLQDVGPVREVDIEWHLPTRIAADLPPSWKDSSAEGGGALLSLGVHSFDYVEWFACPIAEVRGTVSRSGRDSDDGFAAELRLANGASARLSVSTVDPDGQGHCVRIDGEAGSLTLENRDLSDYMRGFTLLRDGAPVELPEPPPGDGRLPAFTALADELVSAVQEDREATPSFREGLRAQRVADALVRSNRSGRWVRV